MRRAVFLDRDGTLNEDDGYVADPAKVRLLPGVLEGLSLLRSLGFLLIGITNQSGIGRGYYTEEDYSRVNARLNELLAAGGAALDAIYHCPHAPETDCACRKPKAGMLEKAIQEWNLDASRCYLMGDKPSDMRAAKSAGVRAIGVGEICGAEGQLADVADAGQAAFFIRDLESREGHKPSTREPRRA